jgi:ABC-type uncharacterized transport system involved in gliding motility auxiliary subunit
MQRVANVLGWLGTAAVAVSLVLRVQTTRPEWAPYSTWAAWAGLVLIVLYVLANWREITQSFSRRQTRLGAIAAGSVVLVLGILVALNYLSSRRNHRWDLTTNKAFSLSDQTRQILQKLDEPVKAVVFDRQDSFDEFRDRLDEYEYVSNRKLTVEYVDPVRDPVRANQNQVQSLGTVVFTYKGRTERVVGTDEQQITNTLIKVLTGTERVLYFLQGHGERDTAGSEREGYNAIVRALEAENYKVETLALAQKPEVPANAAVLIVAGPSTDLLQPEADAIAKYLDRGGKMLALIDPPEKTGQPPLTALAGLLGQWGLEIGNDIVVDTSGVGQLLGMNEVTPVAVRYPAHPIVDRFRVITAYPVSRSVRAASGAPAGRAARTFIESSPQSWAETSLADLFAGKPVRLDEGKDTQGPVSLGAAVSAAAPAPPEPPKPAEGEKPAADAPKPETRVAAIGDSDFAANGYLGIQGNRDIFMNTVSWLAQQEDLISIRPRDPEDRRLTLTGAQQTFVVWGPLVAIPLAIAAVGVAVVRRRRR